MAFPPGPCGPGGASGISRRFQRLSRSGGQVGHVLLTRSPLYVRPKAGLIVRLACVRHAASVHPEPGSNSPFDLGLPVSREREPTGFSNSKIKVNSKKYHVNVLSGMYQSVFRGACLACPRFVTVSGSQGAEGPVPDARASLRRKKELYQHPACRVKENFQEIFPTRCGGAGALRARAPRVSPCEQGLRGWS